MKVIRDKLTAFFRDDRYEIVPWLAWMAGIMAITGVGLAELFQPTTQRLIMYQTDEYEDPQMFWLTLREYTWWGLDYTDRSVRHSGPHRGGWEILEGDEWITLDTWESASLRAIFHPYSSPDETGYSGD